MTDKRGMNLDGSDKFGPIRSAFRREPAEALATPFRWEIPDEESAIGSGPGLVPALAAASEKPSWHPSEILSNLEFPWEC
jgi:hypothetical protein